MKKALILQSWYSTPESDWYPWIKKELEIKGYQVEIPDLPTIRTDLPSLKKMLKAIDKLKFIDKDTVVIGHSIGTLLAMRLSEKTKFKKMILLAGWDFNELTKEHRLFWPNPINHQKIQKNVKQIYCLSSDNDPYITAITSEDMSKRLKAKFILIKGVSHFSKQNGNITKIPQLLKLIN